jgi:hypothetical protein
VRQGTAKGSLQLFGIIAGGTSVFGLWQGYGIGETLIAAVILSAFVVGIAWAGARSMRKLDDHQSWGLPRLRVGNKPPPVGFVTQTIRIPA